MSDKLIKSEAMNQYQKSLRAIQELAEKECKKLGLAGVAVKTMLKNATGEHPVQLTEVQLTAISKKVMQGMSMGATKEGAAGVVTVETASDKVLAESEPKYTLDQLQDASAAEVKKIAVSLGIKPGNKSESIAAIMDKQQNS